MGDHTKWNKVKNEEEKKTRREALQKKWKAHDENFIQALNLLLDRLGKDISISGIDNNNEIVSRIIEIVVKGVNKKIKIIVDHLRNKMIAIGDEVVFEEDCLVLVGSVSERNNLGLVLRGCEGHELQDHITKTKVKGVRERDRRLLRVTELKVVNLERRLNSAAS
jgi:hypothetical protein